MITASSAFQAAHASLQMKVHLAPAGGAVFLPVMFTAAGLPLKPPALLSEL